MEIRGRDWAEFYENAARGLMAIYSPKGRPKAAQTRIFHVSGESPEEALVNWLNEVIYLVSAKRWLPSRVAVTQGSEKKVAARLEGGAIRQAGILSKEVKSATFHDLRIMVSPAGLKTTVIVDV